MFRKRKASAAGWTLPIVLSEYEHAATVIYASVKCSADWNGTWSAYKLSDRIRRSKSVACNITRATTTATVVLKTGATPKVGDLVLVEGAGAPFDGWYPIASVASTTQFTFTVANSGLSVSNPGTRISIFRPTAIVAGMTTQTGDAEGTLAYPVSAVVLNVSAYTAGSLEFILSTPQNG